MPSWTLMAASRESRANVQQLELFPPAPYLSVEQLAEMLGVPKSFIYRRTCEGHEDPIPAYRFGGHLRFRLDEVQVWIEQHRKDTPARANIAAIAARKELGSARTRRAARTLRKGNR